jgi:hypothetical protein
LEKNLPFLDALNDFECTNDMIETMEKECEQFLEEGGPEDSEKKFDF